MLNKTHRFHGRSAVLKLYRDKRAKTIRFGGFTIRYVKSTSGQFRAAVVVSGKVAPKAVTRNRIRRRIYSVLEKATVPEGADIMINVYDANLADLEFAKLESQIHEALKQISR